MKILMKEEFIPKLNEPKRDRKKRTNKVISEETEKIEKPEKTVNTIKTKLESLLIDLLDSCIENTITMEELATKTIIARVAIDYLKIKTTEKEEEETFFKGFDLSTKHPEELLSELDEIETLSNEEKEQH